MVIVNSDDFGYDGLYNRAACLAYEHNLVSSLSCFVNYEEGLKDALECLRQGKIDIDAIGLHANLSAGIPLTNGMRANKRFCVNGVYKNDISIRLFYLDKKSKNDLYLELEAQVEKFISAFGKVPSHIDSHHHLHTHWAVLNVFLKVAKKYQIPVVRIARNIGREAIPKRIYKQLVNKKIRSKGFLTVDFFGDVDDFEHTKTTFKNKNEVMVHAIFDADNRLVDMDGEDLKDKVGRILQPDHDLKNFSDFANAIQTQA